MKNNIIFIMLMIVLLFGFLTGMNSPLALKIGLVFFVFLTVFLWESSIINRDFGSDFKIRSQRKVLETFEFINPILFLSLWILNDFSENSLVLILLSLVKPFVELIMLSRYKTKKPYTLFISHNILILNQRWTRKRNLTELTKIEFNRFSKKMELNFISQMELSIKIKEYKRSDLEKLIEVLINKSEYTVSIPNDLEQKINKCC